MDKIYAKERQVLEMAEKLLGACQFDSVADGEKYKLLYEEYKVLLRQTIKVVRLADRIELELKTVSKELERVSQVDVLTNLYNRMYFMKKCNSEWKCAAETGNALALLMLDIDFFKEYNDTYGHIKGDECLKKVTKQFIKDVNRPRDVIGRFGGDEFVILLPETGIVGAGVIAENILEGVNAMNFEHKGSVPYGRVTVSIGVTAISPHEGTLMEALFQQADRALYKAKGDGRNCFRVL